jgi:hypothetical protein
MEWIQDPNPIPDPVACGVHFCWAYEGSGPIDPCGLRVCVTKFCFANYS